MTAIEAKVLPELSYTEVHYFEVDYNSVDYFIKEVYGYDFECVPTEEWNNYSKQSMKLKKEEHDKYDLEKLEKFKLTGKATYGTTRLCLQDCVNRGIIPEGEYLINISW